MTTADKRLHAQEIERARDQLLKLVNDVDPNHRTVKDAEVIVRASVDMVLYLLCR